MSEGTQPTAADPQEFRRAMGRFATGVTVVTGWADGPVGFTCQSFVSVSLRPPLISLCADENGRAWSQIRSAGRLCVHVLSDDQEGLCQAFGSRAGSKFDGADWSLSEWGTPTLSGVLLRVHADITAVHPAGDHEIALAEVREIEPLADGRPLLFYRGMLGTGMHGPVPAPPSFWENGWG